MSVHYNKSRSASRGVKVGDRAPDFTLPSLTGEPVSLESFLGKKNIVLYFYPKDDNPGCTAEACSFRDADHEQREERIWASHSTSGASASNVVHNPLASSLAHPCRLDSVFPRLLGEQTDTREQ